MSKQFQDAEGDVHYSAREGLDSMSLARNYNKALLDFFNSRHLKNITSYVDFGAGNGFFAKKLRSLGLDILPVEIDPVFGKLLKSQGFTLKKSLDVFSNNSISGMYTFNVLEHIEDDVQTLRLMHKKLRRGGKLLIFVPACMVLYSDFDTAVGHYRRYSLRELKKKTASVGFDIASAHYFDTAGFFAALFYKYTNRSGGKVNESALVFFDKFLFPINFILDPLFRNYFGKNCVLIAVKK